MARRNLMLLISGLLFAQGTAAARPIRMLKQAGAQQYMPDDLHSDLPIPTYVVPGTDVWMLDGTGDRLGQGGGVLSNAAQDSARSGSTYDLYGTRAHTMMVKRASNDLRTAVGMQDHSSYVQEAASGFNLRDDAFDSMRRSEGIAMLTARGVGKTVADPVNRANLAGMDASSAIQRVADGGLDARYATRAGTAAAAAVTVPTSFSFVWAPTWW
ncbi:MAG: hypothetical protein J3K34DRAFT_516290 [Monoraphidium minutum]|nr:MAG: hypothetical protein J3K34DRAFT_516290 [Monoraphidium minutum]